MIALSDEQVHKRPAMQSGKQEIPMSYRCKQKSRVRSSRYCKKALARVQYNIDVVKGAQKLQVLDAVECPLLLRC
jgi:hypothetical protein